MSAYLAPKSLLPPVPWVRASKSRRDARLDQAQLTLTGC